MKNSQGLPDSADWLEAPDTLEEIAEENRGWKAGDASDNTPRDLDDYLTRTPPHPFDGDVVDTEDIP
jgi:hypothetical protein